MKYLGIDGGQSHLEVLLYEDDKVVATAVGGPSHIQGRKMDEVFAQAVKGALDCLPELNGIRAIGIGLSGFSIPGKREAVFSVMKGLFPEALIVIDHDAAISHYGVTGGKDGASILAGTGSIAFGMKGGEQQRLGGFGYLFGDEGGGAWIGLEALRLGMRSIEGRAEATTLAEAAKLYFLVEDLQQLRGCIYERPSVDIKQIAGFAKTVFQQADLGDQAAIRVVQTAGRQLGELACSLLERLKVIQDEAFQVFKLGNIWLGGPLIDHSFEETVLAKFPYSFFGKPCRGAAEGAALFAKVQYESLQILKGGCNENED